jgi:hypothetical protein
MTGTHARKSRRRGRRATIHPRLLGRFFFL